MESAIERLERQKENLVQRSTHSEKELQLRIQQEKNAHDEDIDRMSREQVSELFHLSSVITCTGDTGK
jgi:hypothetical protein